MYDARNELREFVGADRAEAVSRACSFFGASEDELEISTPPAGEVMGLSARTLIVAGLRARQRPAQRAGGGERGPEREPRRGDREGRGERRERRDRPERGDRPEREPRRERGREPEESARPAAAREPRATAPEPSAPSVGVVAGTLSELGQFVLGLIERIDAGPFEITENVDQDLVVIQLKGEAIEALAGGDGRGLDAVQLLVNQVAQREGENARRVVLDAEGDHDRREEYLARLAERAAQRAQQTGRSVAIDPMSPRDRRVVHMALRDAPGIATMSVGAGRYRQVVVVPEGAPEYEEAARQADSASRRDEA